MTARLRPHNGAVRRGKPLTPSLSRPAHPPCNRVALLRRQLNSGCPLWDPSKTYQPQTATEIQVFQAAAELCHRFGRYRTYAEHERIDALNAQREQQIKEWRAGLAAAHAEYQKFLHRLQNEPPRSQAFTNPDIPDIAGAEWFQSLRPHLSDSVESAPYRHGLQVHCNDDVSYVLTDEINRIADEWRHEAG